MDISFFDLTARDIMGNLVSFQKYSDRKLIMVVNVASKWRLTDSNYSKMVELHKSHHEKGFEILAFPCNQFLKEDEDEPIIKKFIEEKY